MRLPDASSSDGCSDSSGSYGVGSSGADECVWVEGVSHHSVVCCGALCLWLLWFFQCCVLVCKQDVQALRMQCYHCHIDVLERCKAHHTRWCLFCLCIVCMLFPRLTTVNCSCSWCASASPVGGCIVCCVCCDFHARGGCHCTL